MAVISPDTFDPLNRFVGVRLQQGVPIVDADENEREDIRQFELRAYLRWFVGDGIPEGNDGFRIDISGASMNNNFVIRAGIPAAPAGSGNLEIGLNHVGRCLVDGLDVIIDSDLNFTAQPLHNSQAGAAARAASLGVPVIQSVPDMNGIVSVYLDVWRRVLTPAERPALVHPGLGTESCARFIREWVVRVRSGLNVPQRVDADFIPGHSYYALARITRRLGDPAIFSVDVADQREKRLMVPPATLISDTLGTSLSDYRRGIGRPAISLREAINSLLRGEMPSTPDAPVSPSPLLDAIRRGFFFDQGNGVVAVWASPRVGGIEQIFATRLDQNNIGAGFAPPVQVTNGVAHSEADTAMASNGDIIVTYRTDAGPGADIMFKRASLSSLGGAAEQTVVNAVGGQSLPSVIVSGNTAVFIFFDTPTVRLQYRRFNLTTNVFIDASPVPLPAPLNIAPDYHATVDNTGNIWIAARMGADIRALRLNPTTGAVDQETTINSVAGPENQPFIMAVSSTDIWLFWHTPTDLRLVRNNGAGWLAPETITVTNATDQQSVAVRDSNGGVWLLFSRGAAGSQDIFLARRNPLTGQWSDPRQITTSAGDDVAPFTIIAPNNAIWLFWASDRTGDVDVYFKRLVTSV